MINVASGDRNAIWPPRCRDALMVSQQGRGKALSRWQRDKWFWDGCKDCRQDKRKESWKEEKTKMTTKWNLINLDLVPPPDKFSAGEEEEGKLFFRDVFRPPLPYPTIPLSSQVEKAKGRMGSDNAPAPVE